MKSFITFSFLFLSFCSLAQDLTLSVNDVSIGLDEYIDYQEIKIKNNSANALNLGLTLESLCRHEDDTVQIQICIGPICFGGVTRTTTWGSAQESLLTLDPGEESGLFKFSMIPSVATYGSRWNVIFFDVNDPSISTTLKVKVGQCDPVATVDEHSYVAPAYPNPAENFIVIPKGQNNNYNSLTVFSSDGLLQEEILLRKDEAEHALNLQSYVSGLYLYYFSSLDGKRSSAKAFLKN